MNRPLVWSSGELFFFSSNREPVHRLLLGPLKGKQRSTKEGCRGTSCRYADDLMNDKMVTMDCHREKRNLCMAWVDVKKAYDSVDHKWLFDAVLDFVL